MKKHHLFALHAFALLAWTPSSHAYSDPTNGSILLQGLIAAMAGGLAFVTLKWATVRGWFNMERLVSRGRAPYPARERDRRDARNQTFEVGEGRPGQGETRFRASRWNGSPTRSTVHQDQAHRCP